MPERICIWGKGHGINRLIDMCRQAGAEILAIVDNNPAKWGTDASGIQTVSPVQLPHINPDFIVVASIAFNEIRKQASTLGFPEERVLDFHASPPEVMSRLGGAYFIYHDTHRLENDTLITEIHRHRVRGKVVHDIPSPVPLDAQLRLATRLLRAFNQAQRDALDMPPVYQVGENWRGVLQRSRQELYRIAEVGDANSLAHLLAHFCRNDLSGAIMGGKAMFQSFKSARHEKWLQHNLDVWMALVDGQACLEEAAMPPIGNPYGYDVNGAIINWNSYVNHARAYRCSKLIDGIERPVVAEIGGGFGGFAYHLMQRNPNAIYIDFDLPENGIIAAYYLSMAYPKRRILLYNSPNLSLSRELLTTYDAVIMPHFMLPKLNDLAADIFINTISFSEMEISTVQEYFRQIDRTANQYFYHENLSCNPPYKGYPSCVFPQLKNFRQLFANFSSWQGFDAYAPAHSYLERLLERN